MALIEKMEKSDLNSSIHQPTHRATYQTITDRNNNNKYLQINTYGSFDREETNRNNVSQSIQFSPESINQLKEILKSFP